MIFEFTIYPEFFIIFMLLVSLIQFSLIYLVDRKIRKLSQAGGASPRKNGSRKEKPRAGKPPDEQHF